MVEHWCGGVCSLSMATSTGDVAATALLRPSLGVPAALAQRRSLRAVAGRTRRRRRGAAGVVRACFNPLGDERILREAIKEPVAFMGGVFAGLLRLDLNEDPLKEWITRTVEASGIAEENSSEESSEADQNDAPQQIEIKANQSGMRCFPTNPMMKRMMREWLSEYPSPVSFQVQPARRAVTGLRRKYGWHSRTRSCYC